LATILDGKALSEKLINGFGRQVDSLRGKNKRVPGIAVIIVGDDYASKLYVSMKEKACLDVGYKSIVERLDASVTTENLLDLISLYNNDDSIDGILVQLPLPAHIDDTKILLSIDPAKDVDGFHPFNVGMLNIGMDTLYPCTPYGIIKLLEEYDIQIEGSHAVVVGASNIVGKPMSALFLKYNATVSICHIMTRNVAEITSQADILVSAVGKPHFITDEFVKEGAVVVDVGMNRVAGKVTGDVDFNSVVEKCSYITPVPGGVGPMTITMLLYNTLKSYKSREKLLV